MTLFQFRFLTPPPSQILEIRKENESLKAKLTGLEASKKSGATTSAPEAKTMDSIFGGFFGSKPAQPAHPETTDVKKLADEAHKAKAELEAARVDHAGRIKSLTEERAAAQAKVDEKEATIQKMVSIQSTVANKLIDSETALEVSKSQLQALRLELDSRSPTEETSNLKQHISEMKAQLDLLSSEKMDLEKKLEIIASQPPVEAAPVIDQSELINVTAQLQEAQGKVEQLQKEKIELETKIEATLAQPAPEPVPVDDSLINGLKQQVQDLESSVTQIKTEKEELEKRLISAESAAAQPPAVEAPTIIDHSEELASLKQTITELTNAKGAAEASISEHTARIAELTASIDSKSAEIESLKSSESQERDEAQKKISVLLSTKDASIAALTAEIATIKAEHAASEENGAREKEEEQKRADIIASEKSTIIAEKAALAAQVEALTAEKTASTSEVEKERSLKVEKEQALEAATSKLAKSIEDAQAHETKISELSAQIKFLEAETTTQKSELVSISSDRDQLLARLTEVKSKSDDLEENLHTLESEVTELQKLLEASNIAAATSTSNVDALKIETKELETKIAKMQQEHSEALQKAEAEKKQQNEEIATLRTEQDHLRTEYGLLEKRIASTKEQLDKERTKTKDLERDLDLERDKNSILTTSKKELQAAMDTSNARLTEELARERSDRKSEFEALETKFSEMESRAATTLADFSQASGSLESLQAEHTTLIQTHETLKSELEAKAEELSANTTKSSELEQQLIDKDMEVKIAEKQNLMTIQQLKAQIKALEEKPAAPPARGHTRAVSSGSPNSSAAPTPKIRSVAPTPSIEVRHSPRSDLSKSAAAVGSPSSSGRGSEIEEVSQRIGELSQQVFNLQEQLKVAEDARRKAEKDSRLKSQWIRQNSPKLQAALASEQNDGGDATTTSSRTPQKSDSVGTVPQAKKTPAGAPRSGSLVQSPASGANAGSSANTPKRKQPAEQGFFSTLFGSSPAHRNPEPERLTEHQQSTGAMLEETLLAKMVLEEDMKIMSTDLETLQKQNRLLMETLVSNAIEVPVLAHSPAAHVQ